jgi:uncharacterized cupredoxin-like copper-binding protein
MKTIQQLLAGFALVLSGSVLAHGDVDHAKPAGPARLEQKPWGIAGDAKAARRSVEVGMDDAMRFTPERIDVRLGETVRFVVRNTGKLMHEFVIGTKQELDEHAALMVRFPTMEHDEPYMAHVPPGRTGEIVWHFNRAGAFDFACLIAGHYQAGMVGKILVAADDRAEGEVRRVDKAAGRITLRHGEIRSLDMPPMTMVFGVRDKAVLDTLKTGDKVRFRAVNEAGSYTVTEIEVVR